MKIGSEAGILPFLEYAHADASPRAFEGLGARYAALAASILAGGRDLDAEALAQREEALDGLISASPEGAACEKGLVLVQDEPGPARARTTSASPMEGTAARSCT